jgi:hypothetical protein
MNERIRNLLIQAQDLARTEVENDPSIKPPYLIPATSVHKGLGLSYEKFAELIVQKCADIGEQYADGNYEVRNQILIHFGLEEPEE